MRWFKTRPERLLGFALPQTADEVPEIEDLASLLASANLPLALLARRTRFRRRGYSRRVLHRNDACELVVCGWLPGQASQIHDHGGSFGAVRVLRGSLTETAFAWRGNLLRPVRRSRCEAGEVSIERPETIHRIENCSTEPAVTLHLYTPPIRSMTRMDVGAEAPAKWAHPWEDAALAI
jgi:cysteine dioxygenase